PDPYRGALKHGCNRPGLSSRRTGATVAGAGREHRRAGLDARQPVLVARQYRAHHYLRRRDCLDRAAFAALFYFRRGMVRRRSRGLLAVTANTRARRVLGLRAGLVVLFRLWLLSGQRALARRSVLRLARPWHRLAGLARCAAPRSWRDLFLRRAADCFLHSPERSDLGRLGRRSDVAVGRYSRPSSWQP